MTSSTPLKRTSAIDIPLILDLICQDLERHHVLACVQVCQSWRSAFQSQLDRFVRLNKNPKVNQEHIRTVIEQAGRIRSLQVDVSDGGWFLDDHVDHDTSLTVASPSESSIDSAAPTPVGRCINLEELSCLDFNYLPRPSHGEEGYFYHPPNRPSIVSQSSNALHLIRQNPKLKSLYVHHARQFYRADHFSIEVLESIAAHKSLTHIKIHLDYAVDSEFRIRMLQYLPETIQDFELVCRPEQDEFVPTAESHLLDIGARNLLSLKRLSLLSNIPLNCSKSPSFLSPPSYWGQTTFSKDDYSEFRFSYPDWLIIPLIRSSPSLEKLAIAGYRGYPNTLMQNLVDFCPNLETIHLGGTNSSIIRPTILLPRDIPFFHDDEGIVVQDRTPLRGMFPKLREFRTTGCSNNLWTNQGHEDVSGLLARSTETLEVVCIGSEDWDWSRPAPFQAGLRESRQSWADCRQLKELTIEPISHMDFSSLDPTITVTTFADINNDDDNGSTATVSNFINTKFESLKHLRLTSLADAPSDECNKTFNYSRLSFNEPTLDDYLQQPSHKYSDTHLQNHRSHRLQFLRRVRELFGRLKLLQRTTGLEKPELEWSNLCVVVKSMTEETVLELLKETEYFQDEEEANVETEEGRSQQGWYGPMTRDDMAWLGLQWPTRSEILAKQEQRERASKK
ncbi:hypothetical protein EC991_008569 [Linnemannia zychae]|nr:hypothetical protein EC991_008569 [Linnemannia zychae]